MFPWLSRDKPASAMALCATTMRVQIGVIARTLRPGACRNGSRRSGFVGRRQGDRSLLFGTDSTDRGTFAGTVLLLNAVAFCRGIYSSALSVTGEPHHGSW